MLLAALPDHLRVRVAEEDWCLSPGCGLLGRLESVKALSAHLGHADAGFTLRTHTHLMPSSETRTRKVVDEMYRTARKPATAP